MRVRAELDGLQRRLAELRRCTVEAAARCGGGLAGTGGGSGVGPPGGAAGNHALSAAASDAGAWCEAFVQEVAGSRFRCSICCKLFRGAEFVRRHVVTKHHAEARRPSLGSYEDGDVSGEGASPAQRRLSGSDGAKVCFSQALQDAADYGDAAQVVTLMGRRADPAQQDDGGTGPLCLAARNGHLQVANALLAHTADGGNALVSQVTGAGLTALHAAAGEGHCAVAAALLAARARLEAACARGKTPLLHAGEGGHSEACVLLVSARAEAQCLTPEGETLLHVASRSGDGDLIAQVVAWRADLLAQDQDGWTPLHEAAHWGAVAVEALCRGRADVRIRSRDGETALHVALAGYERAAACQALLNWHADPMALDIDGESPLHVAARRGNSEACRALLMQSAEVDVRNYAGQVPLDLAQDESTRALLVEHGASG